MPSPPVPTARNSNLIPVSSMDCIRRGGLDGSVDLGDQRFKDSRDSKLLWQQKLIPWRNIAVLGGNTSHSGLPTFNQIMNLVQGSFTFFNSPDATTDFQTYFIPLWGHNYCFTAGGIEFDLPKNKLVEGLFPTFDTTYLWSGWAWTIFGGAIFPNSPVDPTLLSKTGIVTEVICPDAFRPVHYELWTVTIRQGVPPGTVDTGEGPPGPIPTPAPWSLSNDFSQTGSGILTPGEVLLIPCPIGQNPSSPAPPGYGSTYGDIEGWGVAQYIVYKGSG